MPRARRVRYPTPEPQAPYTGHQWLEMARAAVQTSLDLSIHSEARDRYYDDLGEALLAIMEGRDPKQAVIEYRKLEFIPRHLTSHIGDWSGDDPDYAQECWDAVMPTAPSAEEEVVARETVLRKVRYHGGHGKGLMGTPRQQQPSRRRANAA